MRAGGRKAHRLRPSGEARPTGLARREFLRLGLAGGAAFCLGAACRRASRPGPVVPPGDEPVYELSAGSALYDDFDGHGNHQTYDDRDLAEAGKLPPRLWLAYVGSEVVPDPSGTGLFGVFSDTDREIGPAAPGHRPARLVPGFSEASKGLFVRAVRDGYFEAPRGPVPVVRGGSYGEVRIVSPPENGNVLQITNRLENGFTRCLLNNPPEMGFADFDSFGADVKLSSASTARSFNAGMDYHTTIPEQPPGKSWIAQLLLIKSAAGEVYVLGHYVNFNLGLYGGTYLGPAELDRWYNLRLDIVTRARDERLSPEEIRLDYYVDGILRGSRIPEDSPILVDPTRIGWGPQRSFVVVEEGSGESVAFFDNVRAVYRNRIG